MKSGQNARTFSPPQRPFFEKNGSGEDDDDARNERTFSFTHSCRRGENTRARANRHTDTHRERERETHTHRERESSLSRKLRPRKYICEEEGTLFSGLGFCFRVSLKTTFSLETSKQSAKERKREKVSIDFRLRRVALRGRTTRGRKCRRRTLSSPSLLLRRRLPPREEEQVQQQQR